MRACSDPDVVTELPVIEVVAAAGLRLGKGGHFVVFKSGRLGEVVNGTPYLPRHFLVGQQRRVCGKGGIGFDGQLIKGEMRWRPGKRLAQVGKRIRGVLPRQTVHQVNIEVVKTCVLDGATGSRGIAPVMDAAQCTKTLVVETLDAE